MTTSPATGEGTTPVAGEVVYWYLVSTELVSLSTELLKSSSTKVSLWWVFTWNTSIFTFVAIQSLPMNILPNFFLISFLITFPPIPDHSAKSLAIAHGFIHNHTSGHFSFQVKDTTRCTAWSSAHWQNFFLPPSFRDIPERRYGAAAVHFQVLPHTIQPSVLQSLLPFSNDHRGTPYETIGAGQKREGNGNHRHYGHFFFFRLNKVLCFIF